MSLPTEPATIPGRDRVTGQPPPVQVIEPPRKWKLPDLREVWRQRDLMLTLARRDLTVRYKQTFAGFLWVVIQPLAYATVFALALTFLRAAPARVAPYPVLVLTGLNIWLFFTSVVGRGASSVVSATALIQKLHFPRLVLPIASVLPQLVDLAVSFAVLLCVMLVYGVVPEVKILMAPVFVALMLLMAFGIGVWYAALAVRYRDVQQVVPFTLQILLFTSPVIYTLDRLPADARPLMMANPLTGPLEGFRWAVLPGYEAPGWELLVTFVVGLLLVVTGLVYFRFAEHEFADVI